MVKKRGNTRSSGPVKAASGNKVNHHKVKDNGKGKVKDKAKNKVKDKDKVKDKGEYGRWIFDAVLAGGLVTRYKRKDKDNFK